MTLNYEAENIAGYQKTQEVPRFGDSKEGSRFVGFSQFQNIPQNFPTVKNSCIQLPAKPPLKIFIKKKTCVQPPLKIF